ncbi:MAG: hypothetical protein ABSF99_12160, partial [Anaerolineales bacterium]
MNFFGIHLDKALAYEIPMIFIDVYCNDPYKHSDYLPNSCNGRNLLLVISSAFVLLTAWPETKYGRAVTGVLLAVGG